MPKLDRAYSSTYSFKTAKKEIEHYKGYSIEEISAVFNYLNSVAYDYPIKNPPRMDKTIFSYR